MGDWYNGYAEEGNREEPLFFQLQVVLEMSSSICLSTPIKRNDEVLGVFEN